MKTPMDVAAEAVATWEDSRPGGGQLESYVEAAIAARDAEHASSSSVAWEALERIAAHMDGDDRWETFDADDIDFVLGIARAALSLRPGGKPG